jgi:TonB-dependent starch-binding outer membrane protein SusC
MNKLFTRKLVNQSSSTISKLLLFSLLLLSFSFGAIAQNKITGTITDPQGQAIIGAAVKVKGTTIATSSDVNGKFSVSVPNTKSVVVVSFIGFVTKEELVGTKKVLNITLVDDTKVLNEIVVVGYGTVKRKDLTGSVSSVSISDLVKAPVKSFDDALAGRVAGVQVTSPDGMPGAAPTIVIRGANSVTQDNSPLYVIDGFAIENFNNNSLNPSDIESIDVLKDASSTAIYGARGANGVIMITTKKGSVGAPVVSYKGYYGIQSNTKKMNLMDAYEFVRYQLDVDSIPSEGSSSFKIYDIYSATLNPTGTKTLEDYRVEGIDWQDQIFREAPMISSDLSIRGGNKDTKYGFTTSYLHQDGTLIASSFKRFQSRFTLDQVLNKKVKFGVNVNYSNITNPGTKISGERTTSDAFLISAWRYRPVSATGDINELLTSAQDPSLVALSATNYQWNPVFTRNNETRDRNTSLITANANLDYTIIPDLKLRVTGGINSSTFRYDVFNNSLSRLGSPTSSLGNGGPNGSISNTTSNNFLNENTLTYNKVFNQKHTLNVVAGSTIGLNKINVNGFGATLLPNENLGVNGLGQGTPQSVTTTSTQNTLASFLARVNYNYKSKYLATASFRADGSSKFVGDNVWGYFPSGSVAYHISEENFLKNNKIISDAKFRTSYGVIGNNRVSDYASYALLGTGGQNSYSSNSIFLTGTYPLSLSNPLLKWETTKELDFGVDLGFFNQRILLTADYYEKTTDDLLLSSQLPGSSGYSTAFQNIGSVQNKGLEFALTTVNVDKNDFKWNSTLNISFNRNKVLALTSGQQSLTTITSWSGGNRISASPSFIATVGQPIGMFYGLASDGVYQYSDFNLTGGVYVLKPEVPSANADRTRIKPGYWKFKDLNGDLFVNSEDLTTIGNPNPDFIGGFSNNFSYKGFDLNIFMQFSYGNEIMNVNRILMEGGGGTSATKGANMFASYSDRWSSTNPTNEYSMAGAGGQAPDFYPSRVVEDGSFIRLKTVNIGYKLDQSLAKKMGLNGIRVYASAQNLYTLTNYQGLDPEVNAFASALSPGLDYSAYPRAKTITFGLDITL